MLFMIFFEKFDYIFLKLIDYKCNSKGGCEVEENSIEGRNSLKLSLQDKLTAKETTNYGI